MFISAEYWRPIPEDRLTEYRRAVNVADMDWQSLIADLKARNFRQEDIASICNTKQSTVSDLARGATRQPSFALGQALIALHKSKRKAPADKQAA